MIDESSSISLVTIVDQLSLMTLIAKVNKKHADLIAAATTKLLRSYKNQATSSIAGDNGKEFSGHTQIIFQIRR